MAGLLVDVYGLNELPPPLSSPSAPLTCLWLLHPRKRSRSYMNDFARRVIDAWHQTDLHVSRKRHLLAFAFDMPNHGSRQICSTGNLTWGEGNPAHGIDMAGLIESAAADVSLLMGLVGGYLGRAATLMTDRHRHCPLDTPTPLLGSPYFPPDLVSTLQSHDPKSIVFGATSAQPPPTPLPQAEQARLRNILDARVRGKKVLACSGGKDELVPYARSAPLKDAVRPGGWYEDGGFVLEDKVYADVKHEFSAGMVTDAVGFLVKLVAEGPRRVRATT
ncbi:hypothetical protein E4U21_004021 [Claviceps maximensis]|nr:hypothetical protein E4U21_004021 [Claviceps maximensis]